MAEETQVLVKFVTKLSPEYHVPAAQVVSVCGTCYRKGCEGGSNT